jgi:hypothetical protein
VPTPGGDAERHWIRGGDIIFRTGHIVMVADDRPNVLNNSTNFMIMHEWGGTSATDLTMFRRKSVRSPFTWWSNALTPNHHFGKVYIWA